MGHNLARRLRMLAFVLAAALVVTGCSGTAASVSVQEKPAVSVTLTEECAILSGGDVRTEYTEASVMKNWLLEQGVDESRIILDEAARDTYGNAIGTLKALQEMDAHKVLLVGTMLHLPRAVTTTTLYAQYLGYDLTLDSAGGGETAVLDKDEVHYAYVNAARAAGLFTKSDYSNYTT